MGGSSGEIKRDRWFGPSTLGIDETDENLAASRFQTCIYSFSFRQLGLPPHSDRKYRHGSLLVTGVDSARYAGNIGGRLRLGG